MSMSAAGLKLLVNPDFPGVFDVTADDLHAHLNQVTIIDVRGLDEYEGELGHIAGSKLIPLNELDARLGEVSKDQDVVFVCRSGGRSGRATMLAVQNGFQRAYNMRGGMMNWNDQNLPTAK